MAVPVAERPRLANGHLFYSPRGLYPFQAEAVAHCYLRGGMLGIIDWGLGKTIISMATAAQLMEDGLVDLIMHIGRKNKLGKTEFPQDWADFTSLTTHVYHGSGRQKRLAKAGVPDVFLTTYETGRNELMTRVKKPGTRGKGAKVAGPLFEALGLREKRIIWIFDEIPKLASRTSELHQAYAFALSELRKVHRQWVIGMTATPFRTDYVQPYNLARLSNPDRMPTVAVFEEQFTRGKDDNGRYIYTAEARERFATLFNDVIYRKRFSDPDVRDQYPKLIEKQLTVELDPAHNALYQAVGDLYGDQSELDQVQLDKVYMAQRLTAGHPAAHLHSSAELSRAIVATLGEAALRAIPSSKTRALIEELESLVTGQGAQALVFTFYAETVLPEVARDLRAAGLTVATYTGGQTNRENEAAKADFKEGRARVLLSSDAGSEGLNLPEAHYIIEYESARTYDTRTQRFGRATRITSENPFVYGLTMVADKTLEVGTLQTVLRRNAHQDTLLGDTGAAGHTDASMRRRLLRDSQ